MEWKRNKFILFFLFFAAVLIPVLLPLIGRTSFSPILWLSFFSSGQGGEPEILIIKERLGNTLLAFTAGGGLALAGLILQTLFRNPLASPFTLGIAGGASFGAVATISFIPAALQLSGWFGGTGIVFGSLCGAALAAFLVFLLGRGHDLSSETILLAGIGINFFFSGLILFLQYISEEGRTFRMIRWTMGEISLTDFRLLFPFAGIILVAAFLLFLFSRELDILLTGEERALSLGINLNTFRLFLFLISSLLVGIIVSICGPIGFVGLMSPHFARLLTGSEHRILIPVSLLFGALFLSLCWTAARILFYPDILPVGVLTSLLGGPFFIWLLLSRKNNQTFRN